MAFVKPTPADLKLRLPEFADVADATIQTYIDMASRFVDTSWFEEDYTDAILYFAAHLMALAGIGKGPDSVGNASNMSIYQSIRSGQLTLTRGSSASNDAWSFNSTRYGRLFAFFLKLNKGGPRVAIGNMTPVSGYAKDWPR